MEVSAGRAGVERLPVALAAQPLVAVLMEVMGHMILIIMEERLARLAEMAPLPAATTPRPLAVVMPA